MNRLLLIGSCLLFIPLCTFGQKNKAEIAEIKKVIWQETDAYFRQDYQAWRKCWAHTDAVTWTAATRDGVSQFRGWDELSREFLEIMKGGPSKYQIRFTQYNFDVHLYENGALVFFEQDMGSRSREMRVLEKINGKWKLVVAQVVYNVGW